MKTKSNLLGLVAFVLLSICTISCSKHNDGYNHLLMAQDSKECVYITPNGKCYHSSPNCPTLYRSRVINEISISEVRDTRKPCSVCH